MKKLIILLIFLSLTSCTTKEETNNKTPTKETNKIIEEIKTTEEKYIDTNPITPGIYMYYNSYTERKLLTEYTTNWTLNQDLCSLEIYYTNDHTIPSTNQKKLWNDIINTYENIDNYHIGYQIQFETEEETINKYILSPKDTDEIYEYMQIYLYDDINQIDGAWYSHITEEEYNENSILTSIKLTGSTNTDKIITDITLTVFTYDEDDFDKNNNYRGKSKSTIIIKRG